VAQAWAKAMGMSARMSVMKRTSTAQEGTNNEEKDHGDKWGHRRAASTECTT
jgi:hypothetical protein